MFEHLKQWWAAHLTWIAALVSFLTPSVKAWISANPGEAVLVGGIWAFIVHALPAPKSVQALVAYLGSTK